MMLPLSTFCSLKAPLQNSKGVLNIVALAITLPILILLATAAVDIIRLPIVEQQLQQTALSVYDSLQHDNASAGFTVCAVQGKNLRDESCDQCSPSAKKDCSGAKDFQAGKVAVRQAVESAFQQLTSGNVGVTTHDADDVYIDISIFNILVDEDGKVIGKEIVAERDAKQLGAVLASNYSSTNLVNEKFFNSKSPWPGPWIDVVGVRTKQAFPATVAIIHLSVRVEYIFGFAAGLGKESVGDSKTEAVNSKDMQLEVTLLRPLTKNIRLLAH